MEKEHIIIIMEINILENGKKVESMEREYFIGLMVQDMKENLKMEKKKDMVLIILIMAHGKEINI